MIAGLDQSGLGPARSRLLREGRREDEEAARRRTSSTSTTMLELWGAPGAKQARSAIMDARDRGSRRRSRPRSSAATRRTYTPRRPRRPQEAGAEPPVGRLLRRRSACRSVQAINVTTRDVLHRVSTPSSKTTKPAVLAARTCTWASSASSLPALPSRVQDRALPLRVGRRSPARRSIAPRWKKCVALIDSDLRRGARPRVRARGTSATTASAPRSRW